MRDRLREDFKTDHIPAHVRYLPWARLGDIQAALAESYDVVHFIAHGTEGGQLALEDEDGLADLIAPQSIARILRKKGVRLVVLSTCFSGPIGCALNEAGIPSVVMVDEQYPNE